MARKPKAVRPEAEDPAQAERFLETARQIGVDETGEAFERAMKKIAPPRRPNLTGNGGGDRSRKHRRTTKAG